MSYPDAVYSSLGSWAEEALLLIRELLPSMKPLADSVGGTPLHKSTAELLSASARASESALLLVAYGQVWDAEMPVRSVVETTLKLCYLLQDPQKAEDRLQEHAVWLFEIGLLRDDSKIRDLLAHVAHPEGREWKPLRDRLLGEDDLATYKARYPQNERRRLEGKWGFSGLLGELSRSGDPLFAHVGVLAHGYSLSSHIIHGDDIGVSLPLERDLRPADRRDTLTKAHAVRILADVFRCFQLRLSVGYRYAGRQDPTSIHAKIASFLQKHDMVYEDWMTTEYGADR